MLSLSVLNRMLSWVMSRLVSWPEPAALWGPEEETGDVVVDSEREGEWRTKLPRAPLVTPPEVLAPGCDAEERLAMEEDRRGLPVDVTARERLLLWWCPLGSPDPDGGEASELVEEVDECRLVT